MFVHLCKVKIDQVKNETMNTPNYNTIKVDELNIFYREAGSKNNPTILLLHGFPSSSYMYRDLINNLAEDYHLIAPDFPGFGHSDSPSIFDYLSLIHI